MNNHPEPGQRPHRQSDSSEHARHDAHGEHQAHATSLRKLTTAATVHCLVGCAIGEWIGLALGVSMGMNPWATMALASAFGFLGGYTFGLWPLVRGGMTWGQAFRTIWLGETISITAMELAMNFTDYHVGGIQGQSLFSWRFWVGYAAAIPAGFVAAWPVNFWLLKRGIKQHQH